MKKQILSATASACLLLPTLESAQANEQDLLLLAREAATIAGGARFCKADDDMIEEFMAKADANLAFRAKDDYEKVLARLEFKNILAATSVRAPVEGCEDFLPRFENAVKQQR